MAAITISWLQLSVKGTLKEKKSYRMKEFSMD